MRLLLAALVMIGCNGWVSPRFRPYHESKTVYQTCIREHPTSFQDECVTEEKLYSMELERYEVMLAQRAWTMNDAATRRHRRVRAPGYPYRSVP